MVVALDPATGKTDWIGELNRREKIEASPTGADDKIYFQDFRGALFVVATLAQGILISALARQADQRAALPSVDGREDRTRFGGGLGGNDCRRSSGTVGDVTARRCRRAPCSDTSAKPELKTMAARAPVRTICGNVPASANGASTSAPRDRNPSIGYVPT